MRVLVGGLLRNGEAAVGRITQLAVDLEREFTDVIVHVFENNSTDNTPALLLQAAREQPNLLVRSEVWDLDAFRESGKARTSDNGCCRLELLAEARNRLLDWMRKSARSDDDRLVMIDWDFATAPSIDTLARWIRELPEDLDGVFANGADRHGHYYDLYELRTAEHPLGPEIIGDRFWTSRARKRTLHRAIGPGDPPVPCLSAFGGLAIYRAGAVGSCRYSPYPTPELHNFYTDLFAAQPRHREVRRVRREKVTTHYRGALLGAYLFDDVIFYRNNSGYNFPIAAEHVNLHRAMRARGRGRFVIAPDLGYTWSH